MPPCVWLCVHVRVRLRACVHKDVNVRVRGRERERDGKRGRQGKGEKERCTDLMVLTQTPAIAPALLSLQRFMLLCSPNAILVSAIWSPLGDRAARLPHR